MYGIFTKGLRGIPIPLPQNQIELNHVRVRVQVRDASLLANVRSRPDFRDRDSPYYRLRSSPLDYDYRSFGICPSIRSRLHPRRVAALRIGRVLNQECKFAVASR